MKKDIILPELGEGIEKAEVSEVAVSVGDDVAKDDTLLVLESDKASMEIPAEEPGRVLEVLISAGEEISKGQLLVRIETEDSVVPEVKGKNKKPIREKGEAEAGPPPKIDRVPVEIKKGEGVFASPGVRRLARELNIDLNIISGSGPKGRTTKDDLHAYIKLRMDMAAGKTGPIKKEIDFSRWGDVETQKLTRINKITGSRIQEAWQEIPRVTQYDSADITELDTLRKELKKEGNAKGVKVTFLPFLMKAVITVLKEMPRLNSSLSYNEENLVIKKYYNIGVAVDTPGGLVVPSIKDVNKKTIFELSKELMEVSLRAREKKLSPEDLKGSTFTISSLGGIGGSSFSPIINPPEVAILGVSKSEWRPIYDSEKKNLIPRYILPLSLSYDHRVVDGALGATFTKRLTEVLKDPKPLSE